jgi:hypothetical protein
MVSSFASPPSSERTTNSQCIGKVWPSGRAAMATTSASNRAMPALPARVAHSRSPARGGVVATSQARNACVASRPSASAAEVASAACT